MTRIILNGCLGRMGRAVSLLARGFDCAVVAGADAALAEGGADLPYPVAQSVADIEADADAVLDFSGSRQPIGVLLDFCAWRKRPLLLGTTGLSESDQAAVKALAQSVPVFWAASLSLGVNLLAMMLEQYAPLLRGAGFDLEIVERHHNQKLDAPSGMALTLARAANTACGGDMEPVFDRSGRRAARGANEIGVHSLRGGTVVGEHTAVFAGHDEVLEIKHSAQSREVFAAGALRAAKFIAGKPPGLYGMRELIGAE